MNQAINTYITGLNNIGQGFWDYAAGIFIQASVLIVLLLAIDFLLRKRVRAVFRYCLWMLLFVKLVLPASFTLPTGIGYWLGDYFTSEVSIAKFVPQTEEAMPFIIDIQQGYIPLEATMMNETVAAGVELEAICWQGLLFLGWLVGMLVLLALLVQRVCFVRGLIAQSKPANGRLLEMLNECRCQIGIRRNIELRLSGNTLSPAVCGLFKPIILMPAGLLERLSREKLKAVLIHELAHIKRADVWVNLLQTMLQIVYFYNPLVWIANAMIRRAREQAVDEMVLVTLKPETKSYSNTLIDIAEMAFWRPNFSLRLIGVVESKKALERRIKHMLNRGVPKSSKLGFLGLFAIVVIGAIILPMGCGPARQTALETPPPDKIMDKIIVPGVRVGEYTFDMSKDDVLENLGKPEMIFYGEERYTLDDLPRTYYMCFDDTSFRIVDDSVKEIGVHSRLYKFTDGLGVGDSEQKIKQAFGDDFRLKETEWKDFLIYEDQCLQFEISKKDRTVMEFSVYPVESLKFHKKADIPPTSIINEQGHIVDKINYPFVNDPQVTGTWEAVDFVREMEDFKVGEQRWTGRGGELFLNEMIFVKNGRLISKNDKVPRGYRGTWTNGLVIYNNDTKTASKYTLKDMDDSTYMFYEWKSGDYTYRHSKPSYYVLKRASAENSKNEPMYGKKAEVPAASISNEQEHAKIEQADIRSSEDLSSLIRQAVADGRISYKLTTPDEFKAIAGQPTKEWTEDDGDILWLGYPGIQVRFFGKLAIGGSHTIIGLQCEGRWVDLSQERRITLRYEKDLEKFGSIIGYRGGVDLSRLDLSGKGDLLKTMPFDSLTVWPGSDLLPPDFDPEAVIEWGKYPGLRVKQLHDRGVTGKGVRVAIIDQPLLLDHIEYKNQLADYTDIQTGNAGPAMHGAAVASLLVGKTCGTAPGAILHFWAEPSWKGDYKYRCTALEQIIQYNRGKEKSEQIRILSVSKGFSRSEPNLDRWKTLLEKAKQTGIYVVHCSKMGFGAGCRFREDSDNPANYKLCAFYRGGAIYQESGTFFTPIDNRTTASEKGKVAYTFWTRGGLSWGAPYIAGVVALGMQVNPDLSVDQIDKLLYESGWDFQRGKLINPMGFVEAARHAID